MKEIAGVRITIAWKNNDGSYSQTEEIISGKFLTEITVTPPIIPWFGEKADTVAPTESSIRIEWKTPYLNKINLLNGIYEDGNYAND